MFLCTWGPPGCVSHSICRNNDVRTTNSSYPGDQWWEPNSPRRFSHSRHSCGVLKLRVASAAFANVPVGVVMLRPRQRFMCYLCDSEALIGDSVASASAMRDFVIQLLEESLRTEHQKWASDSPSLSCFLPRALALFVWWFKVTWSTFGGFF